MTRWPGRLTVDDATVPAWVWLDLLGDDPEADGFDSPARLWLEAHSVDRLASLWLRDWHRRGEARCPCPAHGNVATVGRLAVYLDRTWRGG